MKLGTTWEFRGLAIHFSTLYTRISHPASKLNCFAHLILARSTLLPAHDPAMALRDLTTSSPLIPLASPSHPPRIPLTPHSRPYTSPSSPSRLSIPCMHHARVHREHSESCTYIHSQHLKDNTRGCQGPASGPPLLRRASSYPVSPIHLSTSFTHHSEKHSHTQ